MIGYLAKIFLAWREYKALEQVADLVLLKFHLYFFPFSTTDYGILFNNLEY